MSQDGRKSEDAGESNRESAATPDLSSQYVANQSAGLLDLGNCNVTIHALAGTSGRDDACPLQHRKVLREVGLAHAQSAAQFCYGIKLALPTRSRIFRRTGLAKAVQMAARLS